MNIENQDKLKNIKITITELIGILVRASLIEQLQRRMALDKKELESLEIENKNYWQRLSKTYGLKNDDIYEIDKTNCSLVKK